MISEAATQLSFCLAYKSSQISVFICYVKKKNALAVFSSKNQGAKVIKMLKNGIIKREPVIMIELICK